MVNYIVKWILKNILLQDVQNVENQLLEYVELDTIFIFLTNYKFQDCCYAVQKSYHPECFTCTKW
jgi:hypothetical protein